jgi:exosortase
MRPGLKSIRFIKKELTYGFLFVMTLLFLYCSTFQGLIKAWVRNEDYNHGFLIVPVSLYLAWIKRRDIISRAPRPSAMGIPLLLLWAVLFILGVGAGISTMERVSIIVFLLGCTLSLAGREITGMLIFPILFLVFMIPIPSEIYTAVTNPLAMLATTCSVSIMHLTAIPVCQEGNLILMPNYSMEVLDACSGIRSLVSIIALALLLGYRIFSSFMEMFCLLMMSIPVSIIGNIIRITITGLFSYACSSRFSFVCTHTVAGISAFLFSFLLLLAVGGIIRWVERKRMQYISSYLR